MKRGRNNQTQEFGPEPTFEEFATARRVMLYVRYWLETHGEHVTLSDCPIFSHIVLNSSALVDPRLFESSHLASAESNYVRTDSDAYQMRHGGGE